MITVDFNRLDIQPGYRVLDIGCGTGRHTSEVSRFKDVVVHGVDLCLKDVVEAKNRMHYHEQVGEHGGGPWMTSVADISSLPFGDSFFDLVICSEVLEHIPDDKKAIHEIIRVLKPGKNLVVSVPRYLPERICWTLSKTYPHKKGGHIRIYKEKELILLIEEQGVEKWATHFAHGLHAPYWWLKCLVGEEREDSKLVNLYHRLLVLDMMKHPPLTRILDSLLNPFIGKSVVVYFRRKYV